jgi:polygalacturonase
MSNFEHYGVNVKDFGAKGDGAADEAGAFQAALDSGAPLVVVPFGAYRIGKTLRIGSNTRLKAHNNAIISLADGVCTGPGDFFLTNKNKDAGDVNITVEGGTWNYNNAGNPRGHSLFDQTGPTGRMIDFHNVKNLTLAGMTLQNPECFYICLCKVENFLVEEISFETTHLTGNQDGVHVAGFCKNGVIRNLHASPYSPNDDFIALNADDIISRQEATGELCGPIENVTISNIEAKECHSFIRINSIDSAVRNIDIDGVRGGTRNFVLNMDAARYCRTPMFKNEDFPGGVGNVENIRISNVKAWAAKPGKCLFCLETKVKNFTVRNFQYDYENAGTPLVNTAFIGNISDERVSVTGLTEEQARLLQTESRCADIRTQPLSDSFRSGLARVSAYVDSEESLVIPPGGFDLLEINKD